VAMGLDHPEKDIKQISTNRITPILPRVGQVTQKWRPGLNRPSSFCYPERAISMRPWNPNLTIRIKPISRACGLLPWRAAVTSRWHG